MTRDRVERLRALTSAVVADALDSIGHRHQTLEPGVGQIGSPASIAGRAATLHVAATNDMPSEPYKLQFAAVDEVEAGDILVVAVPRHVPSAMWGELLTTRAQARGAVGVVLDGYCRDVAQIRELRFAVWARGVHPADSLGRLNATQAGCEIECAGVVVAHGDYVLGDVDGVVIVPSAVIDDVLKRAEEKASLEDVVRANLRQGVSATDVYRRYGVM